MGTNTTDSYEDHCHKLEHPDEEEGSGDDGEEGEGKHSSDRFANSLRMSLRPHLS